MNDRTVDEYGIRRLAGNRRAPYYASDDALLRNTFGMENVEGRIVMGAFTVETEGNTWTAVLIVDAEGKPYLLERTATPDGEEIATGPATQQRWMTATERLLSAAPELVAIEDTEWWLATQNDVRHLVPGWSLDAEEAMWMRLVAQQVGDDTLEQVHPLDAAIERLQAARQADLDPGIDVAIQAGMPALRDGALRRTFDMETLAGKTVVWSLTDLHGERPWRGCVLIEDDGTPHLAEIGVGPDGRPEGRIGPLTMARWSELSTLAYWRLLLTDDERYEPAIENASTLLNALKFDLLGGPIQTGTAAVMDAMTEVAEMRVFGDGPAMH